MPATNAWDETKPAGTDLASTIDNQVRQLKLDIRERLALQHYWNVDVSTDGIHKEISVTPATTNTEILKTNSNQSVTGTSTTPLVNLGATWNTTGIVTAVKVNVTDTASDAASLLIDLQVGGTSKFKVTKAGVISAGSLAASAITGTLGVANGGTGVASFTAHGVVVGNSTSGLVTTAVGSTNTVLHGNTGADPSFSAIVEADLSLSDNTTANVSTTKHGFVPKLPNDATKFLDGTGAWTAVSTPAVSLIGYVSGANTYAGGYVTGATINLPSLTVKDQLLIHVQTSMTVSTSTGLALKESAVSGSVLVTMTTAGETYASFTGIIYYDANQGWVTSGLNDLSSGQVPLRNNVSSLSSAAWTGATRQVTLYTAGTGANTLTWAMALYKRVGQ